MSRVLSATSFIHRSASAFVVLLVLLVLSSAVYFGQVGELEGDVRLFANPLKPSLIYLLTYLFAGLVAMAMLARKVTPACDGFIWLFVIFGALHVAWLPFAESDEVTTRTLVLRMNVVVMTICCQTILSAVSDMRGIIRAVRGVVWATCALNMLVILMPELFDVRMSVYAGRASGLYWDPNQCATFLALLLPLINFGLRRPLRWLQSLIVLVGIFFTFSREGALLWVVAVGLCELIQPGEPRPKHLFRNTLLLGSFVLVLLIAFLLTWSDLIEALRPYLTTDTYARLSGSDEGSASERLLVLQAGLDVFSQDPLFGAGYASTRGWGYGVSVHNMLVLMLAEFGLVGGLWYLAFLGRILTIPLRFGFVLCGLISLGGLFTHSYFDLAYYMLLVVLYWRFAYLAADAKRACPPRSTPRVAI
jgi:O-antigen ligase